LRLNFVRRPDIQNHKKFINKFINKYEEEFSSASGNDLNEVVLKLSRRSYPSVILADENMWRAIQKDDVGNLALSPEESEILDMISGKKADDKVYPLFINGRPGSGKSTILQYLFADHLCMHLRKSVSERLKNPPLYLTYSERLLKSSRQTIEAILRCNAKMVLNGIDLNATENRAIIDNAFGVFHSFLHTLLPNTQRKFFDIKKKIDFPQFRHMWNKRRKTDPSHEVRELSPELAWHVLRTYIKGMRYDTDAEFTPDSYIELPMKQKTVPQQTFERIFSDVWEAWYKKLCEDNGYWDDHDLVFAVMNTGDTDISEYPGIFCDEAQDFSKLELDLILRLSIFSKRSVSHQELKRVPFAFAGDPFQTLNPTGFDWDSVQASFHEKIVQGLDKTSQGKLVFNYQELSYNYRSTKHIVGLCNLLQLLRGILFDIKGLKPQRTWFESHSSMPVFFNIKDPLCEEKLKEQHEIVIILPCQEGEEDEFVRKDPDLNRLFSSDIEIRNFMSPMTAKGLEFSRVVLYKFGKICYENYPEFFKPLPAGKSHGEDREKSLPLEYFMNHLYVAASRAKNRLIIIDDDIGIKTLWDRADMKDMEALIKKYPKAEEYGWNIDLINYVSPGISDSWTEDRDDPLTLGEMLCEAGNAEKDPYKLRLAVANFKRAGQDTKAKRCEAQMYEIEEQYEKAGNIYLELNNKDKALRCFWKSKSYSKIINTAEFANTIQQRAASFMISDKSNAECEKFLEFLCEELEGENKAEILTDNHWIIIFDKVIEAVSKFKGSVNWPRIYGQIKTIEKAGLTPTIYKYYADVAYMANEFKTALSLWDFSKEPPVNEVKYKRAKAYTANYPDNIKWLIEIAEEDKIIEEWVNHKSIKIDFEHAKIITNCLLNKKRIDDALTVVEQYPDETMFDMILSNVKKIGKTDMVAKTALSFMAYRLNNREWKEAINLIEKKNLKKEIRNRLIKIITYEIATSERFYDETLSETKNIVADFLKRIYIDSPWNNIVPMEVAGAAIEKAHKIIDSLEFYEAVWKNKKIEVDVEKNKYAIRRWVKCKLKYAEYLKVNRKDGVGKHRDEAEEVCNKYLGINKDNIEDEPSFEYDKSIWNKDMLNSSQFLISDKTREGILALHKAGWAPTDIAESYKIKVDVVENIICKS